MSGEISETNIIKVIGHPIMGALGALLTWMSTGWAGSVPPTLAALLSAIGGIGALGFSLLYRRYFGLLGATKRRGTSERASYDALRESLAGGNLAARLYARWLTAFLDWIERFFGDAGMADRTLFPHFFWLKKPAPLWTARAFDRCLVLALIYPIAAVFLIWAITGHVGPAESALGLRPDLPGWLRGLAVAAIGFSTFAFWRGALTAGWKRLVWLYSAVAVAGAVAGAGAVLVLSERAIKHGWHGFFLALFLPTMIVVCFVAADLLSPLTSWKNAGPLLLFLGLLTLLNAPFDWASLGLTRALLRRGLELGGWVPWGLALADAVLATGIIAVLTLAMVIGVQAFDELAVHGGGKPVLPLEVLFDGIGKNPAAPEYWWVYALLLSSMIPSFINLMIAWTSMLRGIPGLSAVLLRFMPERQAVPAFDRTWVALVLTVQIFVGAFLGLVLQVVLAWGLIFYVMPTVGLDLLDMARCVAAADLPKRVGQFFAGAH